MFLGREALEDHSQLPKKANKCSVGAVASFSYIGMSASSLHRESTDSLISFSSMDCPPGLPWPWQSSNCDCEFELQFAEIIGTES